MRRPTAISALFSPLKVGFASALALAFAISCTDSTAPSWQMPDGVISVNYTAPDSVKQAYLATFAGNVLVTPADVSANLLAPSGAARSASAGSIKYIVSKPSFSPEAIPNIIVPLDKTGGDGVQQNIPLGFNFDFFGVTYDKVNIWSNGFLQFGQPSVDIFRTGFMRGDAIPDPAVPNNIIAFAWADWEPQTNPGGIRFETRGTAPNRKFIMQFNNVPEWKGTGILMAQVILEEGSNAITIYTNTMSTTNPNQRITQGIENADGTLKAADSVQNPITGVWSMRIRAVFKLTNDAVRFAPPRPPVVFAPKDALVPTTPPSAEGVSSLAFTARVGACDAIVNPGFATATGDVKIATIVGVRSDDATLPLEGHYRKGATTITWTATDEDGSKATANQLVTVVDEEKPLIAAPQDIVANNDLHRASAVVSVGSPEAVDNCPDFKVTNARSDKAAIDAPFPVGTTTVTWTATDASGNLSTANQSITVRDIEAPIFGALANLTVPATSPSGAVVTYSFSAEDNVAVAVASCTPKSGSLFPIGPNRVECTATDAAGNETKASFTVSVLDARTQLQSLIEYVRALGAANGTANPLLNQLTTALEHIGADNHVSCVKLNDFLALIPKKGREIPFSATSYMTTEATRIMSVLGCEMGPRALLVPGAA
jgi:hypothetical protein